MERLTRLDGLRGVLAVYIMICHALPYVSVPHLLAASFNHGEAAVDLFFALSGLVVVNSLERFHFRFRPFIQGRARRLLPVYFTVLALAVLLELLGSPLAAMPWLSASSIAGSFWANADPGTYPWHVAAHVMLVQGLLPHGVSRWGWITVLAPAWSLSTEWQFYIVMALGMARLGGPRRMTHFAYLMLAAGIFYHGIAPLLPQFWQFSRAFLPDAAPYFALGLASAVWMRGGDPKPFVLCLIAVCALGMISEVPAKALTPVIWAVLLLAQRHSRMPLLPRMLDSRLAQYLGAISYPLYLVNEPVQRAAAMLIAPLAHGHAGFFSMLWLPAALVLPVPAAMALHHWVEMPAMRLHWQPSATQKLLGSVAGCRLFTRRAPDASRQVQIS